MNVEYCVLSYLLTWMSGKSNSWDEVLIDVFLSQEDLCIARAPQGIDIRLQCGFCKVSSGCSSLNCPVYNFPRKLFSYILIQLMIVSCQSSPRIIVRLSQTITALFIWRVDIEKSYSYDHPSNYSMCMSIGRQDMLKDSWIG